MRLDAPLQTITAGVDGEVLAVLAGAEHWFGVGDLATLIPERSREGLRKSLRRLVEQGVVDVLPSGRTALYRLNREHLAAPSIIALASLRATFSERLAAELSTWEPVPDFAAIFGSAARGPMRTDSDIDLFLLHAEDDASGWEPSIVRVTSRATRWTGNDVRPLVMTSAEIADAPEPDPVLRDILSDGVAVAGDRAALRRLIRARP